MATLDGIGLVTFMRTYAREVEHEGDAKRVETWREALTRVVDAANSQLHCGFTDAEKAEFFGLLESLKCSVAGRFLWQLGTKTVDKLGLMSLQNCGFITVNHPVTPFTWTFESLMLGTGIGYSVLPENVYELPVVQDVVITRRDSRDADYIVPDSREGWVKLIGKVMKAHFYSGTSFEYSLHCLRSKGAPIKQFGGIASGPEELEAGITDICGVLAKRRGAKLRPIDVLDVMNIIGRVVVSGNTRRSAEICIGDCKDLDYVRAKRWDLGNVPNYRCYSNNSVVCDDIADVLANDEFWQGYEGNGEPYGLINMRLARSCGRLGETQYPDPRVAGVNPCA